VWIGIRLLGLGSILWVRSVEPTTFFCMAPGSSVHCACVHVPHSSPDTLRARDTDRDIGNVCASDVQCNATLQSAMTISTKRRRPPVGRIVPCILIVCLCTFIVPAGTLRLPWLRVFRAFSSVVRQMLRYNPQRRGTACTLPNFCVVLYIVCFVSSVYCLCVNVYCTTATGWLPNCS